MIKNSLLSLSRIVSDYIRQIKNATAGNRQPVPFPQTILSAQTTEPNKNSHILDYDPEKTIASRPAFNRIPDSIKEMAAYKNNTCSYAEYSLDESLRKRTFQFDDFKVVVAKKSTIFQVSKVITYQITFITISFDYSM